MQQAVSVNALVPSYLRADAPRREERVRVLIWFNRFGASHAIVAGQLIERPKDITQPVEVVCYRSDVRSIEDFVETDVAEIAQAEKQSVSFMRREAARLTGHRVEDLQGPVAEWPDTAREVAEKEVLESVEKHFFARTDHSIRPLARIEIAEELPPPQSEQDAQAAAVARAILGTVATSKHDELAELRAMNAALLERLERLEKKK